MNWAATTLTGTAATVIAMLSVAALGALMLTGRLPARRGAEVVIGSFVLFSARLIAAALLGAVQPAVAMYAPSAAAPAPYVPTTPKPVPYDPYAGASVPRADQDHPILR